MYAALRMYVWACIAMCGGPLFVCFMICENKENSVSIFLSWFIQTCQTGLPKMTFLLVFAGNEFKYLYLLAGLRISYISVKMVSAFPLLGWFMFCSWFCSHANTYQPHAHSMFTQRYPKRFQRSLTNECVNRHRHIHKTVCYIHWLYIFDYIDLKVANRTTTWENVWKHNWLGIAFGLSEYSHQNWIKPIVVCCNGINLLFVFVCMRLTQRYIYFVFVVVWLLFLFNRSFFGLTNPWSVVELTCARPAHIHSMEECVSLLW